MSARFRNCALCIIKPHVVMSGMHLQIWLHSILLVQFLLLLILLKIS